MMIVHVSWLVCIFCVRSCHMRGAEEHKVYGSYIPPIQFYILMHLLYLLTVLYTFPPYIIICDDNN